MKHQKAIFNQVGSLEDIEIIEAETELLVSGEIRVEMLRAPIRHADLNLIAGNYGEKVNFPFTPGGEGVGRVIESLHPEFFEGDLVIPLKRLAGGTWSEVWQDSGSLFYKINKLSEEQAATLRVNPLSALLMLEAFVPESGGQVLINAGNSEVGLCLQAIALKKGIPLVACVRRKEAKELILQALPKLEDKRVIVEGKGSDLTFEKLAEEKPFTLALNAVGGESALRQLNHLAFGGKQITYGAMSGKPSRVLANHLIFKNLRLEGFWLHSWTEKVSPDVVRQKLSELETMSLPLLQPNFFTF